MKLKTSSCPTVKACCGNWFTNSSAILSVSNGSVVVLPFTITNLLLQQIYSSVKYIIYENLRLTICQQLQLQHQFDNILTALHGMQTRSSDENSVCLSVCHTREL